MRRYFLHLRDHTEETIDPEGTLLSLDAAVKTAVASARDCMAGDVKAGRLDLRFRIDVEDDTGTLVHRVPFPQALDIILPD